MYVSDSMRCRLLLDRLDARATGIWRVEGGVLVQTGFSAADDMPKEVADGFALATLRIPLDRVELGVVKAIVQRKVEVSVAEELPDGVGSGYWLRAFAAGRSVAVPLLDEFGSKPAVFSVALALDDRSHDAIASVVLEIARC